MLWRCCFSLINLHTTLNSICAQKNIQQAHNCLHTMYETRIFYKGTPLQGKRAIATAPTLQQARPSQRVNKYAPKYQNTSNTSVCILHPCIYNTEPTDITAMSTTTAIWYYPKLQTKLCRPMYAILTINAATVTAWWGAITIGQRDALNLVECEHGLSGIGIDVHAPNALETHQLAHLYEQKSHTLKNRIKPN